MLKTSFLNQYAALKEANAPGDFPEILADVQHKLILNAFFGFPSMPNLWTKSTTLTDFKTHNRAWLSEFGDLQKVSPGGPYQAGKLTDQSYGIAAETFGLTYSLLRQTIINDDRDAFKDVPTKMGKSAKRTLAKEVVGILERNELAYDGSAILRSANTGNTNLSADATGIATLQAGIKAIATATDPDSGENMGLRSKYLVVSPDVAETAKWLLNATALIGSTSSLENNPLRNPALTKNQSPLTLVIEPMMSNNFANRWYLFADPEDSHAIEVGYLDGLQEPTLLLKKADTLRIAGGGDDPWGYDYDDIDYKVRWDFKAKAAFYQAVYKGGS